MFYRYPDLFFKFLVPAGAAGLRSIGARARPAFEVVWYVSRTYAYAYFLCPMHTTLVLRA